MKRSPVSEAGSKNSKRKSLSSGSGPSRTRPELPEGMTPEQEALLTTMAERLHDMKSDRELRGQRAAQRKRNS